MKVQGLAIIFIILILPISIIIGEYASFQIQTFKLERLYDTRLITATHDALKTFQINTFNDTTKDIVNSKVNIIEAAANSFYNSMETAFSLQGYSKETLKQYVPALVFTMYDGYYIYSPYTNIAQSKSEVNSKEQNELILDIDLAENAEHIEFGLKPYVYYSCRYVANEGDEENEIDIVINYSLDNYITVQGKIGTENVYKSGYLLTIADSETDEGLYKKYDSAKGIYTYYYSGQKIETEQNMTEELVIQIKNADTEEITTTTKEYKYIKLNGTKYYLETEPEEDLNQDKVIDEKDQYIFHLMGGRKKKQITRKDNEELFNKYVWHMELNRSAISYYKNAYEFTTWVNQNLGELKLGDSKEVTYAGDSSTKIFENEQIEYASSNFNLHRKEVIRYSIESNLSVAIANFNKYANAGVNFQMPKLKDTEWDMLENEVSIISFLQGLNIGGKMYNGYTVVTNDKTDEYVSEETIYITTNDGYYHKINDKKFASNDFDVNSVEDGILSLDFEPRKDGQTGATYVQKSGLASYSSVVGQEKVNNNYDTIYEYLEAKKEDINSRIRQIYYKALARERWGTFKVENPSGLEQILNEMVASYDYTNGNEGIVIDGLVRHYEGNNIDGLGNSGNGSRVLEWKDLSGNFNGIMMNGVFGDEIPDDGLIANSEGYVNFEGISDYSASVESLMREGDWVNIGQINGLTSVTLETKFMINTELTADNFYLISNSNAGGMGLRVNPQEKVEFYIVFKNGERKTVTVNEKLEVNVVYHAFAIYDKESGYMAIYMKDTRETGNNFLKADTTYLNDISEPTENTVMALGVNPWGNEGKQTDYGWANVKMYTARIYNKALSLNEMIRNIDATPNGNGGSTEPVVSVAPNIEISNLSYSPEWFSSNPNNIVKPVLSADLKVTDGGTPINKVAYTFTQISDVTNPDLSWSYLYSNLTGKLGTIEEGINSAEISAGGTWYLHVKATSGTEEKTAYGTCTVQEDSDRPNILIEDKESSTDTAQYTIPLGQVGVSIEKVAIISPDMISGIKDNSGTITITDPNGEMHTQTGLSITGLSTIPVLINANQVGDWILTVTVQDNAGNTGTASRIYKVIKEEEPVTYTVAITDYNSVNGTDTIVYSGNTKFNFKKKITVETAEGESTPIVKYAFVPATVTPTESDYSLYTTSGIDKEVNLNLKTQLQYKLWVRVYVGSELKQETNKQYSFYEQALDKI